MCALKSTKIRLLIPAGAAAATPPLGPVLGQYGLNTVQFCKDFNEITENLALFFSEDIVDELGGFVLIVDIYIYEDRTYKFVLAKPPISFLLRLLAGVSKGAPQTIVGFISASELVFLAQFKYPALSLYAACNTIRAAARSIGIRITI